MRPSSSGARPPRVGLLVLSLRPGALALCGLVGAYVFQKASYGLLSGCVTAYVVFLLALAGAAEGQVAVARIVATALGGAIALAVQGADALRPRRA